MYLIEIFLPLRDNDGNPFAGEKLTGVGAELARKFGGLTAFTRAPAEGLWKDEDATSRHDDIVIFEVMTETLDRAWWTAYRKELETTFRQEEIVIRAQTIERL